MKQVFGDRDCQAAVFVYKDDNTRVPASAELQKLSKTGSVRAELHDNKRQFLTGLRKWGRHVDPQNAFLCVYAHMDDTGICCVDFDDGRLITWQRLAQALPRRVEVLWLVGCDSRQAIAVWSKSMNPVRRFLVATSASVHFLPLVPIFRYEISIDPLFYFDEMPTVLKHKQPALARVSSYHEVVRKKFVPVFRRVVVTQHLKYKLSLIK